MRSFSKDELKNYNGRNEKPAYVGYKGLVYDVSESFHWKEGQHWVYHEAGLDLTAEMEHAHILRTYC